MIQFEEKKKGYGTLESKILNAITLDVNQVRGSWRTI